MSVGLGVCVSVHVVERVKKEGERKHGRVERVEVSIDR